MKKPATSVSILIPPLLGCVLVLAIGCGPTRKLKDDQKLLSRNVIDGKPEGLDKSDLELFIKQRPNRKVLFYRLYLGIFSSVNQDKIEGRKIKRRKRVERINARRIEKVNKKNAVRQASGKKLKKPVLKKAEILTRREWLLRIGEPPVLFDSLAAQRSARQINQYLQQKGFFHAETKDTVIIKRKKAEVHYRITSGKPYLIKNLDYRIEDWLLGYYVYSDTASSLIRKGDRYDIDRLQLERDRITRLLRNDGYYQFSKEYIFFEADSSAGNRQVELVLSIKSPVLTDKNNPDSVITTDHKRYSLDRILVYLNHDNKKSGISMDTLETDGVYMIYPGEMRYKSRLITDAIFLNSGDLYQQSQADLTYRRLSELKLFSAIQISFKETENDLLECKIFLSNIPRQSFTAETEGINTSGTLGIAGSLIYQNKNSFRGGEIFEAKLKGALEVQKTREDEENQLLTGLESPLPFNTLELGSEVNLYIPRFLVPVKFQTSKLNNAKTSIGGVYNFQRRPDYGRSTANLSFGYSWNETSTKKHVLNPLEFNLVNIFRPSAALQATLENSKDLFLKNSYSDHITLGSRWGFVFNNQNIRRKKSFSYLRLGAEAAGNLLRWVFNLSDQYITPMPYKGGSFMIDSIPFSQFLRFDADYRFYKILNESDRLVQRVAFGVGKPLHNLRVLPLEKSFFAGGPNSLRAWTARTLGPGSYSDSSGTNFADKIGDVKFEANLEYRFKVIKIINLAAFVDAGNIWLRKPYADFPGGEITDANGNLIPFSKMASHLAIGTGLGLRLDFNFFIIRLDGAIKVKDPAKINTNAWVIGNQQVRDIVWNFGIGYPF